MRAGGVAATKVALDYDIVLLIKEGATEGTGRYTRHATDTFLAINLVRAGLFIE